MKTGAIISAIFILLALFMLGCQISGTIVLEDAFDIRIVNRSGGTVRLQWDETSYQYLDDGSFIIVSSVDSGYHQIVWEDTSTRSRSKTRPRQTFSLEIDASIEVVIQDDSDIIIVEL